MIEAIQAWVFKQLVGSGAFATWVRHGLTSVAVVVFVQYLGVDENLVLAWIPETVQLLLAALAGLVGLVASRKNKLL